MADGDDVDDEFGAMQTVYSALARLDEAAQQRVLDYVSSRLGIAATSRAVQSKVPSKVGGSADPELDEQNEGQAEEQPLAE